MSTIFKALPGRYYVQWPEEEDAKLLMVSAHDYAITSTPGVGVNTLTMSEFIQENDPLFYEKYRLLIEGKA